ncbi:MAG: DUF4038 domain-containing protein [Thermoanaerobaculia bacterium]
MRFAAAHNHTGKTGMIDRKRSTGALMIVLGWSVLVPFRAAAQNSTALSWQPWEQELISTVDYTASSGNPYRDLALAVQYWRMPGGTTSCGAPVTGSDSTTYFTGYGFWEGVKKNASAGWDTNNKRFLIRSTFSDGTWCWKTTCQRSLPDSSPSSTPDCATDTGLNKTGQVTVAKATSPVRLYAVGLPKVAPDRRSLVYGDNATQFLWLGETAWDAPIHYGSGAQWLGFVTDRTAPSKDFRTVLVAPATQSVQPVPSGGFQGFGTARTDCSAAEKAVVPNRCTTWDARYWEQFDDLVLKANSTRKGLMVIVAGVMDPLVRGGDNNGLNVSFPRTAEARVFARNLAARLAGYFVFYSPSYDAKTVPESGVNLTVNGDSVTTLIKNVGAAIKSAAPRHLIGVHLAGSNPLGDYLSFAGETWLDFQMFQSGHGGSNAGAPCNYSIDFQRTVCRAREGALELRCIHEASPTYTPLAVCVNGNNADRVGTPKPAVNVEGEYESAYVKVTQNGTTTLVRDLSELTPSRARSRHTAWATAFSGSFGFNIGLYRDVVAWTNPAAYSNNYTEARRTNLFQSDDDLGRMSLLLGQSPWSQYVPGHTLVCGNFPATTSPDPCGTGNTIRPEELKRHIGITDKVILVHVPGVGPKPSQQPVVRLLSRDLLAGLTCSSRSVTWVDPRPGTNLREVTAKCDAVANGVQFSVPLNSPSLGCSDAQPTCDWILKLQSKTLASANAPNVSGDPTAVSSRLEAKLGLTDNDLQVWTEIDPDSQGASVWAQLLDANGDPIGDSFLVHPLDPRMRSLPTATRDSLGNFLVVWEEEGDNSTYNILAVQISNDGVLLGDPLLVNGSTDDQNGDPAATSDSGGFSYVTWTEYPLDGSLGNVWIQIFGPLGTPPGDVPNALVVTNDPGNQFGSQVQADGQGGVVVAWNSDPPPADATLAKGKPAAGQGVYFRKLRRNGRAWGPAHAVHGNGKGRDRLVDLKVKANGKFRIVWKTVNDAGEIEGMYEQDFDSEGNPVSARKRLGSGS